jgi:hypothetical protein
MDWAGSSTASGLIFYPNANLGFFFTMSFVELIFPLWLVIRGWKIPDPTA